MALRSKETTWLAVVIALRCASALQPVPRHAVRAPMKAAPRGLAPDRATTQAALIALTSLPGLAHAEAAVWVEPVTTVVRPALFVAQFMFLCRILLSWYPEINLNKLPFNLVSWPTEPILRATRSVVPPAFGVDISPVIWIAVANLAQELLLGPQGVLILLAKS
mmetsp:Transcript_9854/g.31639  ORF Transcript_9854/g.31639 Transcript_9854/m.31639 type:complete len:164 (+) Transcript_9854:44-535(+)